MEMNGCTIFGLNHALEPPLGPWAVEAYPIMEKNPYPNKTKLL